MDLSTIIQGAFSDDWHPVQSLDCKYYIEYWTDPVEYNVYYDFHVVLRSGGYTSGNLDLELIIRDALTERLLKVYTWENVPVSKLAEIGQEIQHLINYKYAE